jgi:hypothetical protein
MWFRAGLSQQGPENKLCRKRQSQEKASTENMTHELKSWHVIFSVTSGMSRFVKGGITSDRRGKTPQREQAVVFPLL